MSGRWRKGALLPAGQPTRPSGGGATRLRAAATLTLALALPGLLLATTGGGGGTPAWASRAAGLAVRDRAMVRMREWRGRSVDVPRRAGRVDVRAGEGVGAAVDQPLERSSERAAQAATTQSPAVVAAPPAAAAAPAPAPGAEPEPKPALVAWAVEQPPKKAEEEVVPKPAAPKPRPPAAAAAAAPPPPPPPPPKAALDPETAAFPGARLPSAAGSTPADGLDPLAARIAYAVHGSPRALGKTVASDVAKAKKKSGGPDAGTDQDGPVAASARGWAPYPPGPPPPPARTSPPPVATARAPSGKRRPTKEELTIHPAAAGLGGAAVHPALALTLTAADCASGAAMAAAATAQLPGWALAPSSALVERYLPDACAALLPALNTSEWGLQDPGPVVAVAGGEEEGDGQGGGEAAPPPRRASDSAAWPWVATPGDNPESGRPHGGDAKRYFRTVAEENREGGAAVLPPRAAMVVVGPATGTTCYAPSGGGGAATTTRSVFARSRPCGCTSTILLPELNAARYLGVLGAAGSGVSAKDAAAAAAAFRAADGALTFEQRAPGAVWRGVVAPGATAGTSRRLALVAAAGPGRPGADPRLDVALVSAPPAGSAAEAALGGAASASALVRPRATLQAALGRRVVLVIPPDGEPASSAAADDVTLAWALASRSAVAMPPNPSVCTGLMEDLLKPWTHFIPLGEGKKGDGTVGNATAAVEWCEAHLEKCEAVGAAGAAWIEKWRFGEAGALGEAIGRVAFADGKA